MTFFQVGHFLNRAGPWPVSTLAAPASLGDSEPESLTFLRNSVYLFIYFWLRWVFVAARGLFIVVASLVAEHGL